jgi:hypothetical protein
MNNEEPTTSVRRVSAKDRKARLEPVESLFSDEPVPPQKPAESERFPPIAPHVPRTSRNRWKSRKNNQPMVTKRGSTRQNVITLLFIVATVGVIIYFVLVWYNPYSTINPLAPPTEVIYVTATPSSGVDHRRFQLAENGVLYGTHPAGGECEHRVIAGTVKDGAGLQVRLMGENFEAEVSGGSAPAYGENGFEISLPDTLPNSEYTVQLWQNAPRSEAITVVISEDCALNLAIVSFIPVSEE